MHNFFAYSIKGHAIKWSTYGFGGKPARILPASNKAILQLHGLETNRTLYEFPSNFAVQVDDEVA